MINEAIHTCTTRAVASGFTVLDTCDNTVTIHTYVGDAVIYVAPDWRVVLEVQSNADLGGELAQLVVCSSLHQIANGLGVMISSTSGASAEGWLLADAALPDEVRARFCKKDAK